MPRSLLRTRTTEAGDFVVHLNNETLAHVLSLPACPVRAILVAAPVVVLWETGSGRLVTRQQARELAAQPSAVKPRRGWQIRLCPALCTLLDDLADLLSEADTAPGRFHSRSARAGRF